MKDPWDLLISYLMVTGAVLVSLRPLLSKHLCGIATVIDVLLTNRLTTCMNKSPVTGQTKKRISESWLSTMSLQNLVCASQNSCSQTSTYKWPNNVDSPFCVLLGMSLKTLTSLQAKYKFKTRNIVREDQVILVRIRK